MLGQKLNPKNQNPFGIALHGTLPFVECSSALKPKPYDYFGALLRHV